MIACLTVRGVRAPRAVERDTGGRAHAVSDHEQRLRPSNVANLAPAPAPNSTCSDFSTVIRVLEAHVACVTVTRTSAPQLLPYTVASIGRSMLAELAKEERVDLESVAIALRCAADLPSVVAAALGAVVRAAETACHPQHAQLRAALAVYPDELALWLVGELAVVIGRLGEISQRRLVRAALLSALGTFAEVHGLEPEVCPRGDEEGLT